MGRGKRGVFKALLNSAANERTEFRPSFSFFGNSGQPLDDVFKYLTTEDRLGVAQQTLEWSHIAPTCPDTLCRALTLLSLYFFANA